MPLTDKGIAYCLVSPNESDSNLEPANVVDGLYYIARGLYAVAKAIHALGTGYSEEGQPGALEVAAKELRDGLEQIAISIDAGLTSVSESLDPPEKPT